MLLMVSLQMSLTNGLMILLEGSTNYFVKLGSKYLRERPALSLDSNVENILSSREMH